MITLAQLERAIIVVRRELQGLGFWSRRMEDIRVVLAPISFLKHGWYYRRMICLPALRLFPIGDVFSKQQGLRDLVRHEFAHAFADLNRSRLRRSGFAHIFSGGYDSGHSYVYDRNFHVSAYASRMPREDFAETFALFIKHRGKRPQWLRSASLRAKWRFVQQLQHQ